MSDLIRIRASSLSLYPDCLRRTAARLFRYFVKLAGFELRHLPNGIGAATGTGTHAGATYSLKQKIDTGEIGNQTEAEHRALDSLKEQAAEGISWDQTSPDLNTAEKQVVRQVRAYRTHVAPTTEPIAVEEELRAKFGDRFEIVGHSDCREERRIRDLKTGIQRRANGFQYGCYSLLARGNGFEIDELIEDYIPRNRITKPQGTPEKYPYDIQEAEKAAFAIIQRMADDLLLFQEGDPSRDIEAGDPWAFLANPQSMLCSQKYCPAFGTDFCKSHKE